jgi:hypothetical protein
LLVSVERFLADLYRIFIAQMPVVVIGYITGGVGLLWHDQNIQNRFTISHKVHGLSASIHTIHFILFFQFASRVGSPELFSKIKETACRLDSVALRHSTFSILSCADGTCVQSKPPLEESIVIALSPNALILST